VSFVQHQDGMDPLPDDGGDVLLDGGEERRRHQLALDVQGQADLPVEVPLSEGDVGDVGEPEVHRGQAGAQSAQHAVLAYARFAHDNCVLPGDDGVGQAIHRVSPSGLGPEGLVGDILVEGTAAKVEEFEDVAFNLNPGQVSDVFRTRFGFHIVKLYDRQPPAIPPLQAIRDQIADEVKEQKREQALGDYLDALRSKAVVEEL